MPYPERSAIVGAIKYVDKVVPQINRDKIAAFKKLHFDVMFVGDDWKGNSLFEYVENEFKKNSVDIIYFPYTKGTSSTKLTEVLNDILKEKRK
jgi:glycerol-3-phosphate cytidylyltransferase